MHPFFFFSPITVLNFSLDFWNFTRAFSFKDNCLKVFSMGSQRRRAGASLWDTSGSTAKTKVCKLVTWHIGGWRFLLGPGFMVLVTEIKPKMSVTEPSEAESCFQVYSWDHNWQFRCLLKASLFIHGLNVSLPIWSPQLPAKHLCPWMDAKLFGWKI